MRLERALQQMHDRLDARSRDWQATSDPNEVLQGISFAFTGRGRSETERKYRLMAVQAVRLMPAMGCFESEQAGHLLQDSLRAALDAADGRGPSPDWLRHDREMNGSRRAREMRQEAPSWIGWAWLDAVHRLRHESGLHAAQAVAGYVPSILGLDVREAGLALVSEVFRQTAWDPWKQPGWKIRLFKPGAIPANAARAEACRLLCRAYEEEDWRSLPVAADALEEAGCTEAASLERIKQPWAIRFACPCCDGKGTIQGRSIVPEDGRPVQLDDRPCFQCQKEGFIPVPWWKGHDLLDALMAAAGRRIPSARC